MSRIREILDNTVTRIEALTARTPYTRPAAKFEHNPTIYDPQDIRDVQSPTRQFVLQANGAPGGVGSIGQVTEWTELQCGLTLTIAYQQGPDAWALEKVIAEDLADLKGQIERIDGYPAAATLSLRECAAGSIARAGQSKGVALVTIPITVRYTADLT